MSLLCQIAKDKFFNYAFEFATDLLNSRHLLDPISPLQQSILDPPMPIASALQNEMWMTNYTALLALNSSMIGPTQHIINAKFSGIIKWIFTAAYNKAQKVRLQAMCLISKIAKTCPTLIMKEEDNVDFFHFCFGQGFGFKDEHPLITI